MKALRVQPSKIGGKLTLPPSKSQTMRALAFALLASGESAITNPLDSPDVDAMIEGIQALGAQVAYSAGCIKVSGTGGIPIKQKSACDVGNSGIAFRFLTALAALTEGPFIIDGDASIRERRPIRPLASAIEQLGGTCTLLSKKNAPILVEGPLTGSTCHLNGADSQPVSALLIAGSQLRELSISVSQLGEAPWIDLTLGWLDRLKIPYKRGDKLTVYKSAIAPFEYRVPPDMSSLSFPLLASILSENSLEVDGIDRDQGDVALLDWLNVEVEKNIARGKRPIGGEIDVNCAIDTIPILSVAGCFAEKPLTLRNGSIARKKECDRIRVMTDQLRKMGAQIDEFEDGMRIKRAQLSGAKLECAHDHRVAMALSVAALFARGESVIEGAGCLNKTYKNYVEEMNRLGAKMEWVS